LYIVGGTKEKELVMKSHRYGRKRNSCDDDDDVRDSVILKSYKNTLYYRGEIREPEATEFCIKLKELSDEYSEMDQCLLFYFTTEGGDVFAGLSMYEALKNSKVAVHVIAESCVCSIGTIIMLGATKRLMRKTSVILIHSLSSWMEGYQKPMKIREELKNSQTLLDIMSEVYREHTRLTKQELKRLYDTDMYLRYTKCVQLRFVDGIC
jgi:ATP-dependent protease ClpP protease subunit